MHTNALSNAYCGVDSKFALGTAPTYRAIFRPRNGLLAKSPTPRPVSPLAGAPACTACPRKRVVRARRAADARLPRGDRPRIAVGCL